MIRTLILSLLAIAALSAAPPETPSFPATDAGRRAAAFFEALNHGEAAMRAFYEANVSPEGLEQRSIPSGETLAS